MGSILTLKKDKISEINQDLFRESILKCYEDGITAIAPLGRCGETVVLFGSEGNGRCSLVSVRNYCGDPELLITDKKGRFLFYGRFHISMGLDFVAARYYQIFCMVEEFIEDEIPDRPSIANMSINERASDTRTLFRHIF